MKYIYKRSRDYKKRLRENIPLLWEKYLVITRKLSINKKSFTIVHATLLPFGSVFGPPVDEMFYTKST